MAIVEDSFRQAVSATGVDMLSYKNSTTLKHAQAVALVSDVAGSFTPLGTAANPLVADISGTTGNLSMYFNSGIAATSTTVAANAAQKVVEVESTTGFLTGGHVCYTLVGGVIEYNVCTVTDADTLTMATNIGTGGIAIDSMVTMISESEYQAVTIGLWTPRLTTSQRDDIAALAGLFIYNETTNRLNVYDSTEWVDIVSRNSIGDVTIANLMSLSSIGTNTLYVDPKGTGTYTTLSAAEAAAYALTPSTANEFLIVINGEVAETANLTKRDHIHWLIMPGASITVTSTSTLNAINLTNLTNCVIAAVDPGRPQIIRAGAVGGQSIGLYTTGCTSGVKFVNLNVSNITTGAANCYGINNEDGSPTMTNCTGTGGAGGASCIGISNYTASPTMTNCTGIGGAGGANCYGINNYSSSNPTMTNCTGIGGAGGTACVGININLRCNPVMTDCVGTGGAGGADGYGIYINQYSSPTMTNCTGIGGAGGPSCVGINQAGGGPMMKGCTGIGGDGGTDCHGIINQTDSYPTMVNCTGIGGGALTASVSTAISATTRTEDAFPATAFTFAWRITGVHINVTAGAAAGVTLTLGDTTGGGNALSAAVDVSTTGIKTIPITGHRILAANTKAYAVLSASDATLAYTIYYTYEKCFVTCYALFQDTVCAVLIQDCNFISNAASDAIYVTNNGDDRTVFTGGSAHSGLNDGTRMKAINCQSAWNPGQVYNMVLSGGSTNLTAAAGTANGSNVEL